MQTVYMLTALAATAQPGGINGGRKLLRYEVVSPSIRPPGVITMEVSGSSSATPVTATFDPANPLAPIPITSIDGRVHNADGSLANTLNPDGSVATLSCSHVAALASNTAQGTVSLQTGLNKLRLAIVQAANNLCDGNGNTTASNPPGSCTAPLAWVRGTDPVTPRFSTTLNTAPNPVPAPIPTSTPLPTPVPVTSGSNSGTGSDNSGHGHDDDHNPTPTPTPIPTPTPVPTPISSACDASSTASCFTNLDLSAPQLSAIPLFTGNPGNSGDAAVYQAQTPNVVANENQAVLDYIAARKASNTDYIELASTSLNPAQTYGSRDKPVVLVITGSSLKLLGTTLTGFGILQVPNDFEIQNSTLQWTGIVMVRSSSGPFLIDTGARGSINGALMLQSGNQFFLTTTSAGAGNFKITYSCEAIDIAMGSQPLKIVSQTENSN
jgi:hypothetical protein